MEHNFYDQIVNISKAGAYDILAQQVKELQEDKSLLLAAAKKALIVMKRVDENFGYFTETGELEHAIKQASKIKRP
jgi:hypothetical protein